MKSKIKKEYPTVQYTSWTVSDVKSFSFNICFAFSQVETAQDWKKIYLLSGYFYAVLACGWMGESSVCAVAVSCYCPQCRCLFLVRCFSPPSDNFYSSDSRDYVYFLEFTSIPFLNSGFVTRLSLLCFSGEYFWTYEQGLWHWLKVKLIYYMRGGICRNLILDIGCWFDLCFIVFSPLFSPKLKICHLIFIARSCVCMNRNVVHLYKSYNVCCSIDYENFNIPRPFFWSDHFLEYWLLL